MIPVKIIFHHTADSTQAPQFAKIDIYHRRQGFPMSSLRYYVGYHYLIEINGNIKQARKSDEIGAHTRGENDGAIGIALAGNFNTHLPSESQKISAAALTKELMEEWKIPITKLEPHRKFGATDCPGKYLPDDWLAKNYIKYEINKIRKMIRAIALLISKLKCIKNLNT